MGSGPGSGGEMTSVAGLGGAGAGSLRLSVWCSGLVAVASHGGAAGTAAFLGIGGLVVGLWRRWQRGLVWLAAALAQDCCGPFGCLPAAVGMDCACQGMALGFDSVLWCLMFAP